MHKEMNDYDTAEEKSSVGVGIWIVLGIILLVWGAYSAFIAPRIEENKFDPFNALFSGFAFWGVIYAILLQKSELALQRRELELTRREVRGQKEQLEAQNTTLKQQRFENTFFRSSIAAGKQMSVTTLEPFITLLNLLPPAISSRSNSMSI